MTVHESLPLFETKPRAWAERPTALAGRQAAFRKRGVVAEIKPHTAGGIRDGITQLKARRNALRKRGRDPEETRYHLITYRQVDADPARFETFISDPRTMTAVLSGTGMPTFLKMGNEPIHFPRAIEKIPVHQCPTMLGNELEPKIRARYAAWMRTKQGHTGFRLGAKDASTTGADVTHELVEFLRELAAELEAESY